MKRNAISILALLSLLPLGGCGSSDKGERIISKDVFGYDAGKADVEKIGKVDLLYKANSDVPYISLEQGGGYLNYVRENAIGKDSLITLQQEKGKATFSTPNACKAVVDLASQKITYTDFTGFLSHVQPYKDTFALFSPPPASCVHLLENQYEKGESFVIDLTAYPKIDIYEKGESLYLPLTTFNDLFLNPTAMINLIYDFDKVFLLDNEAPFTVKDQDGEDVLSPLGKAYFTGKEDNPKVSKEYAEYNYENICLNFDYLYGVRGIKNRDYETFDDYLSKKGYKEDLLSGDVKKMDAAFAYAISYLKDGHTAANRFSPLYPYGDAEMSISKLEPEGIQDQKESEALNEKRKLSGANLGYSLDTENRIAYIAFNDFDSIDEKAVAKKSWTEQDLQNSVNLFAYAYDDIVNHHLDDVDYVAVDLATNNGGSSDGMVYMLGTLIGRFSVNIQDPCDKTHAKSTFAVDLNHDGKLDEKDLSLRELGKKIVFIDTHYAFSCGNALPVLAKDNYPDDVITIGETTGGGTCVIRPVYNALGSFYYVSGLLMLSKASESGLVDIEDGVPADIALDKNLTIDRQAVARALLGE